MAKIVVPKNWSDDALSTFTGFINTEVENDPNLREFDMPVHRNEEAMQSMQVTLVVARGEFPEDAYAPMLAIMVKAQQDILRDQFSVAFKILPNSAQSTFAKVHKGPARWFGGSTNVA